ncbi:MAG: GNAT family N-acetyltransferase [Anaerolineae bacterium]|nr:GNAT family N-acetyltransferase [Anaerolineae bacterium]
MMKIRRAIPEDAGGLATVVQEVWGQAIDLRTCHSQIKSDTGAIWVAVEGKEIAGFVSAFLTVSRDGVRRWEVDLLAVRPVYRGQQLGQKLVKATWIDVCHHYVDFARAAVRVDNIASQRSFERAGYTTDGRVYNLLVWLPEPAETPVVYPQRVTFLPVNTLTYRGLWLEGLTSNGLVEDELRQAVAAARTLIARQGRDNTGALIPVTDETRLADDLRATANSLGEYHWWRKPSMILRK